jgi:hypothetical protein
MQAEGRSAQWLADKLNCDRTNIYKLYRKANMDVWRVLQISRVLDHDFFAECSEMVRTKKKM